MLEFLITFYSIVLYSIGWTFLSVALLIAPILIGWFLISLAYELRPSQWTNDKPWMRMYD